MSRASILFLFLALTKAFTQGVSYTVDVDLQLGRADATEMILIKLEPIRTGVVFQRLAYPASCPSSRPGEFALKKTNPGSGFAIREPISNTCGFIDSVTIDTTSVYEVHSPKGELFYLQIIGSQGGMVNLRITTVKPSPVLRKPANPGTAHADGEARRADGRLETPKETWKAGFRGPTFQRM